MIADELRTACDATWWQPVISPAQVHQLVSLLHQQACYHSICAGRMLEAVAAGRMEFQAVGPTLCETAAVVKELRLALDEAGQVRHCSTLRQKCSSSRLLRALRAKASQLRLGCSSSCNNA